MLGNGLGASWGVRGGLLGASWTSLGVSWGSLGASWGPFGNFLGLPWEPLRMICSTSDVRKLIFQTTLIFLAFSHTFGLRGRSWGALGEVLGALGASWGRLGAPWWLLGCFLVALAGSGAPN